MKKNKTIVAIIAGSSLLFIPVLTVTAAPLSSSRQSYQIAETSNQSQSQPRQNSLSATDRNFVTEAAQGGMAEVKLGQLASKRATKAEVKQFGQRMVRDHSQANKELQQLASKKGIKLPSDIGEEHKAALTRLSKLSGAQFDQAYMSLMTEDHNKDISLFENQAQQGQDPDLKAWAAKTLPTLQQHDQLAQSITGNRNATRSNR
ncbi:DUF4142 domain-containing protein [Gloeothece verrucosa]|uniref:Outer membrane protein n=1 Tax=Gloeothece verrucosa (strain PCC 7822) TaxID=497965 RepID=E0UH58_GLOV7|nr:DUF4142 domain-containing protein [Gloeothece verrucosa]ADN15657.1 outer membrane protein [Gloeothece verrucosa PCC 7822]